MHRPDWANPNHVGYTPSELRKERNISPGDQVKWHANARNVIGAEVGEPAGVVVRYLGLRDAVILMDSNGSCTDCLLKFIEKI